MRHAANTRQGCERARNQAIESARKHHELRCAPTEAVRSEQHYGARILDSARAAVTEAYVVLRGPLGSHSEVAVGYERYGDAGEAVLRPLDQINRRAQQHHRQHHGNDEDGNPASAVAQCPPERAVGRDDPLMSRLEPATCIPMSSRRGPRGLSNVLAHGANRALLAPA